MNDPIPSCGADIDGRVSAMMNWYFWQDVGVYHVVLLGVALYLLAWRANRRRSDNFDGEPVFAVILGIATGNPRFRVSREQALRHAVNAVEPTSPVARYLDRIYNNSRIDKRYFSVPDLGYEADEEHAEELIEQPKAFYPADGSFKVPTDMRFQRFRECALPLATRVCKKVLQQVGVRPSSVGQIVIVTSTGMGGDGFEKDLVRGIGLSETVKTELVYFNGCGAGINGLRRASEYARTHPRRLALLVSVELPSLHMHKGNDVNQAILHAIFGDGCAAALIGGETSRTYKPGSLAVLDNRSWLLDRTEDGIKMILGDNGVSCKLSKRLPDYVSASVADFVEEMLGTHGVTQGDIDFWALHPGGHRIVEETRRSLGLSLEETEGCWGVLRDHGNMISATVLFVLERALAEHQRLRAAGKQGLQHVVALSFSPGVYVEGLLLRALPAVHPSSFY